MRQSARSLLGDYLVCDLADRKGFLCGKILGDLGADVIKIEPPGGDADRRLGPFFRDIPDPEKSLPWLAYNTSKRGITLDITTAEGRRIFKELVARASFVIESFAPGFMDGLGLGYSALAGISPAVVMVSITPFGQTGPYRDYKATDIVAMAMGGVMHQTGDPDRAPVRVGVAQSYPQAGAQAAAAAMIAHHHRQATGEGQHVDVSMQQALVPILIPGIDLWQGQELLRTRAGPGMSSGHLRRQVIFPCKDGFVCWASHVSVQGGKTNAMVRWMDSEGMAPESMKEIDFRTISWPDVSEDQLQSWQDAVTGFFLTHTRDELFEGARKWEALLFPLRTIEDVVASPQLEHRGFWQDLEYPELGRTIRHPGLYFQSNEVSARMKCRAPLIGEHNDEVYRDMLGMSQTEIATLVEKGII